MAIPAVENQYNASQQASPQKILSKDDFLKLFTIQLRHQNPLNPMNNTEFTAQLAQFSSLEQLQNMNTQIHDLLLYQNSLQNTLISSLIGKKVKISGNEITLKENAEISYSLQKEASQMKISIYDVNGALVKEVDLGQQTPGEKSYVWDGTDKYGTHLPEGQYSFTVEASDISGTPVEVITTVYGTVTGITFENNITYLVIDGTYRIQLNEIREIKGGV